MFERLTCLSIFVASSCAAAPTTPTRSPSNDPRCHSAGSRFCHFVDREECEQYFGDWGTGEDHREQCATLPTRTEKSEEETGRRAVQDQGCRLDDRSDPLWVSCPGFITRDECDEFGARLGRRFHLVCDEALPTRAVIHQRRESEERKHEAELQLADCQSKLDDDLEAGVTCWTEHEAQWQDLGRDMHLVGSCFKTERERLQRLRDCIAGPEKSDDEILSKQECLKAFRPPRSGIAETCAPLHVDAIDSKVALELKYDEVKQHVDAIAVDARARKDRCRGTLAAGLVARLRTDSSITATQVKGCAYKVVGTVEATTSDGWVIVRLYEGAEAGLKTSTRYVDGALVRADNVTFLGVRSFSRIDGGTATVATFRAP